MRVDFYLLSETEQEAVLHFTCRLIRKAHLKYANILVWAANASQAKRLNALLWAFSDESFIPHRIQEQARPNADYPVQLIGQKFGQISDSTDFDLVISLNQSEQAIAPLDLQDNQRVAEIISGSETAKQLGRQRYAQYRDNGFKLDIHPIP